jgi:hypothetical protein
MFLSCTDAEARSGSLVTMTTGRTGWAAPKSHGGVGVCVGGWDER